MSSSCFSAITPFKFNAIVSGAAGFLFFFGWWIILDINVQYSEVISQTKVYNAPGILATFALIGTNIIPSEVIYGAIPKSDGCCNPVVARLLLFLCLMASFGCMIAASYILINDFILDQTQNQWTGWGIFLQNSFILIACMMMRFAKKRDL